MYSPKIKEEFIPILYKISTSKKMPMTRLVNQIIEDYLETNYQIETRGHQNRLEEGNSNQSRIDEGDTPEVFRRLGEEFLKEELRKEEESRLRRLRKGREKRNQDLIKNKTCS